MTTPDLPTFLTQRYDEQEAVALAASNPPWVALTLFPTRSEVTNETEIDGGVIVRTPSKDDADVTHIATHDPAYVLADLAAKRRIVELHSDGGTVAARFDQACHVDGYGLPSPDDCETLRALAQPFADHPNFRPEWEL